MLTSQGFIEYAKTFVPQLQVKFKDQSWFMRLLGKLLFFNKAFMTRFTTTIGYTIYLPSQASYEADPDSWLNILTHEFVHASDYKKYGWLFSISYLMPQLFATAVLATWFSSYWLFALLLLLFLAPVPSYFRSVWETRGYTMNAAFNYWVNGVMPDPSNYVDRFTGSAYYFMYPFRNSMLNRLRTAFDNITNEEVFFDSPYSIVHNWIQENK